MTAMFRTLNINKTAGLVYADSNEDVHVLGKYNPDDPDTINPILEKIAQDDLTNAISFSYRYDDGLHRMAAHCAYYATRKELELREITLDQDEEGDDVGEIVLLSYLASIISLKNSLLMPLVNYYTHAYRDAVKSISGLNETELSRLYLLRSAGHADYHSIYQNINSYADSPWKLPAMDFWTAFYWSQRLGEPMVNIYEEMPMNRMEED